MKAYVGTKLVQAAPAIKDGRPGYKVVYEDGYESWSPEDTFLRCYREVTPLERAIVIDD